MGWLGFSTQQQDAALSDEHGNEGKKAINSRRLPPPVAAVP
jgi:hypothetical protein